MKPLSMKDQILNFITDNPKCTVRQIHEALGFDLVNVNMVVHRARRNGVLCSTPVEGTRFVQWTTATDVDGDFEPRRIVVQQWPRPEHAPKTWASPLEWVPA